MWTMARPPSWTGYVAHPWSVQGRRGNHTTYQCDHSSPSIQSGSRARDQWASEHERAGLLFIDTPGHHAFTTLRARGGALADMAILVVDISQGFQPQTLEALQILRSCRTPFVVAATRSTGFTGGGHMRISRSSYRSNTRTTA